MKKIPINKIIPTIVQNAVLNLITQSTPFKHGLLYSVQIILGHLEWHLLQQQLLPEDLLHFQYTYYRPDFSSDPRKKDEGI